MSRRASAASLPATLACRIEMVVFLAVVCFTYLSITRPYLDSNQASRIGLTYSIVERGELNIDGLVAEGATDDWARHGGHWACSPRFLPRSAGPASALASPRCLDGAAPGGRRARRVPRVFATQLGASAVLMLVATRTEPLRIRAGRTFSAKCSFRSSCKTRRA